MSGRASMYVLYGKTDEKVVLGISSLNYFLKFRV